MSSGESRQQKVEGPKVEAAENAYTHVYCSANLFYYCTNKAESQGMTLSALAHRQTYRVTDLFRIPGDHLLCQVENEN